MQFFINQSHPVSGGAQNETLYRSVPDPLGKGCGDAFVRA